MIPIASPAAWCAYLAAGTSVISFGALLLLFITGGIDGPVNDAASVFQMISLTPVASALHVRLQPARCWELC